MKQLSRFIFKTYAFTYYFSIIILLCVSVFWFWEHNLLMCLFAGLYILALAAWDYRYYNEIIFPKQLEISRMRFEVESLISRIATAIKNPDYEEKINQALTDTIESYYVPEKWESLFIKEIAPILIAGNMIHLSMSICLGNNLTFFVGLTSSLFVVYMNHYFLSEKTKYEGSRTVLLHAKDLCQKTLNDLEKVNSGDSDNKVVYTPSDN